MSNKCILVASIIGLLIFSFTGCSNLDDKKNKFAQKENLAAKNKVQDKVDPNNLGDKSDGIEPTSAGSGNRDDKIQPTAANSEDEADENVDGTSIIRSAKINKSLPEYMFWIWGEIDDNFLKVSEIQIYEGTKKDKLIQKIDIEDANVPDSLENGGVEFVDANFDGYLDLQVQMGMGAGPNISYSYWLWNKDKSKYIQSQELSELTSTKFYNVNKTITSENSSQAGAYYTESVYKYLYGKLTLIKFTERIADTEKKLFNYTVKELVNNEMKISKQYSEPYE
jgi:hypothetical protein